MIGPSIEQGYFVFTMMPSLACSLNCPHCYLSKEQRRSNDLLTIPQLKIACDKVAKYYEERGLERKKIICYWYGGEPTEMGKEYFTEAFKVIAESFPENEGYDVSHTVLSSLVTMDSSWYPFLFDQCGGYIQTSFDGLMRGKGYVRKWEKKVRELIDFGYQVATISVVNNELYSDGPVQVIDYLSELGVCETSWLPFMLNDQNNETGAYLKYAPSMEQYSDFMISLTDRYFERKDLGLNVPEIGQMRFIWGQMEISSSEISNIASQTLFLMPNGDLSLPDYRNGYQEFLRPFGNILTSSFGDVLKSKERNKYIRKQLLRNNNPECMGCSKSDRCLMEFYKENRKGDDCFGAKKFVEHVELKSRLKKGNTCLY